MQPLASSAHEHRFVGRVHMGIGFFFAIAAALLNPIEMAVGLVVLTPVAFAAVYLGVLRRNARQAIATAAPARTDEREEPGALSRRLAWFIAGEVGVMLVLAGIGHAPGLMAGIAFGIGFAFLGTSRLIERWEVAHGTSLLRDPATRRFYAAGPQR
jgi:hypothetical protein